MEILKDLEICTDKGLQTRPSAKMVRKDCCAQAYLAGAFLAGGSVNAPTTSNYHLEISTSEQELAEFLCRLMNRFYLPAKIIQRRAQHVVYLKASDKIADFLRMCKADQPCWSLRIPASSAIFTIRSHGWITVSWPMR